MVDTCIDVNVIGYKLGVQAGFYSDVVDRVLDLRSKGHRFDPRPGHGDFLRVRDEWRPTETHMVISVGRHLSRTLKKSPCPGRGFVIVILKLIPNIIVSFEILCFLFVLYLK